MKILSAQQLYKADQITIKNVGITPLDLMEHAIIDLKNISGTSTIIQMIENITLSINRLKNNEAIALDLNSSEIEEKNKEDLNLIDQFVYEMDFEYLQNVYKYSDRSI